MPVYFELMIVTTRLKFEIKDSHKPNDLQTYPSDGSINWHQEVQNRNTHVPEGPIENYRRNEIKGDLKKESKFRQLPKDKGRKKAWGE